MANIFMKILLQLKLSHNHGRVLFFRRRWGGGAQKNYDGRAKHSNIDCLIYLGIWRTCKHSVEGVVLVRDLCYEFSIWDINLWSALLTQINKFSIYKVCMSNIINNYFLLQSFYIKGSVREK